MRVSAVICCAVVTASAVIGHVVFDISESEVVLWVLPGSCWSCLQKLVAFDTVSEIRHWIS